MRIITIEHGGIPFGVHMSVHPGSVRYEFVREDVEEAAPLVWQPTSAELDALSVRGIEVSRELLEQELERLLRGVDEDEDVFAHCLDAPSNHSPFR